LVIHLRRKRKLRSFAHHRILSVHVKVVASTKLALYVYVSLTERKINAYSIVWLGPLSRVEFFR